MIARSEAVHKAARMMRYPVDTDWVIHFLNRQRDIVTKLTVFQADSVVSVMSLAELGATALRQGLVLLTNNRRHFELIEGLKLLPVL